MTISIITVSFNSAATIRDTLESVRRQSYPNVEHIVVDGASSDGTLEIVREFSHVRKWVSEPDRGLYDAMNKGIQMASGEIVGMLNSDDFYVHDEVLARVVAALTQHRAAALYADLRYVHREHIHRTVRYWKSGEFSPSRFRTGWMPPHPTFFVRRSLYQSLGGYNPEFQCSADYELMLRYLYKHRIAVCYLPEVLVHMRTGGLSSRSIRQRWRANREDYRAWLVNDLRPPFYTTLLKPLRKLPQFWPINRHLPLS